MDSSWNDDRDIMPVGVKNNLGVFFLILGTAWSLGFPSPSQSEDQESHRLLGVLQTLNELSVGHDLLARAMKTWKIEQLDQLSESVIQWGKVSRTDTTLTRYFDPKTGF